MANTDAESVDDMVEASSREVMSGQVDIGPAHTRQPPYKQSGKQRRQQHTESGQYDTGGEDRLDFGELGIHSAENRIMLKATIPMNCASLALWNCSPSPSLPKSMPTTRKSNKAGTPKR